MAVKKYKCPNCSANLEVDNDVSTLFCKYCGAKVPLADTASTVDRVLKSVTNASKRFQEQSIEYKKKHLEYVNSEEYKKQERESDRRFMKDFLIYFGFLFIIIIFVFIMESCDNNKGSKNSIYLECTKDNKNYILKLEKEEGLTCAACDDEMINELEGKYIDIDNLIMSKKNIKIYFENQGGVCK